MNSRYGRLAHLLWERLRLPAPRVKRPDARWIGVLGEGPWYPPVEWEMKMHLPLAKALKRLKQMGRCDNRQRRSPAN